MRFKYVCEFENGLQRIFWSSDSLVDVKIPFNQEGLRSIAQVSNLKVVK